MIEAKKNDQKMNNHIFRNMLFVYPFQDEDCLWQVCEALGEDRWACRIVNGVFMGRHYKSVYLGQDAVFDEDHILACVSLDDLSAKIKARFGRLSQRNQNGQLQSDTVDGTVQESQSSP